MSYFQKVCFGATISIFSARFVRSKENLVCRTYCLFCFLHLYKLYCPNIYYIQIWIQTNVQTCLKNAFWHWVNIHEWQVLKISQHLLCPFSLYTVGIYTKFTFQLDTFFNLLSVAYMFAGAFLYNNIIIIRNKKWKWTRIQEKNENF